MGFFDKFFKIKSLIKKIAPIIKKHGPIVADIILSLEEAGLFKLPTYVHIVLELFDSNDEEVLDITLEEMAKVEKTEKKGKEKLDHVVTKLIENDKLPQVTETKKDKVINTIESILKIAKEI